MGLTNATDARLFVKRSVDVAGAVLGIVVLWPLALVICVLIRLTSPGPAVFSQNRVGRLGHVFKVYKFRSLVADANQRLAAQPEMLEWDGPIFRVRRDPRVTAVGRILRRFSLDELPQLVNVLIGDMSLVGPRPHMEEEVARYEPWHHRRLVCRPGMTCLWQVAGRHDLSFDDWIRLDLSYIDNWSLRLDLKILLKTVPVVVLGRGDY